jgi:flagellar hook-basal body complex protein FliE
MDALSALKMVAPQLGLQSLNPAQEAGAAQSISMPDLEKLGSGIASQPVGPAQSGGGSFQNLLGNFVNEVSAQQNTASDTVNGLLSGKNVSLHQAMISMEEASVSFQMMVEVRNKLLDSYQELMRMQV